MASPEKLAPPRDRSVTVNFTCQRCCQPLKLHASYSDIDEQTVSELSAPLYPNTGTESDTSFVQTFQGTLDSAEDGVSRKLVLPDSLVEVGNGFLVVGSTPSDKKKSDNTLRITASLFDMLSDQSDVDHPLCEECTDNLLDQMDNQLKIAEDECKEYSEFLEKLDAASDENEIEKLQEELEALKKEEFELQKELYNIEEKEASIKESLKLYKEEQEKVEQDEKRYWAEYSMFKRQLFLLEDEQRSVDNQLLYAEKQLEKLKKTNIFNATFHIWYNGHFGTINSFRLGRLQSIPVDWSEINAAWGQTALLLHSLAKKIDFTFERYRLVPYGNHSYLESLDDKAKELPLYCSGGIKYLWDTKFDQAMVAFLDCLQQFKDKGAGKGLCLPYNMESGKIEDTNTGNSYSIKIQFNSHEQWTKALKFMLTNLKWALAWVSSQFAKAP